jgi:hypothetical protein
LYPGLEVPLYNGASESVVYNDKEILGQTRSYQINEAVPPDEIFSFYSKELTKLGFKPNNQIAFPSQETKDYIRQGSWTTPPARYFKGWTNQTNSIVIKTTVTYTVDNKVKISLFVHPYSDPQPLFGYIDELKKAGEDEEFNKILSQYGSQDRDIDIEKALKEQPKNKIVIKLAQLMKEAKDELRKNYNEFINQK